MSIGLCRLDQLADIRLGVKTFLNQFFYVDQERIERFAIESRFLEPVFRTKDAKRDRFTQSSTSTKLSIFLCDKKLNELTGTGAAAYITWGSKQRYPPKNGGPGGWWKETPAVKPAERLWYQNQAMPPPARIMLLKLIDESFSPLILDEPIRVDQSFNQVNAKPGVDEDLLVGLLCSAWFAMTLETRGRTAMGQGALQVPTEMLRAFDVPDVRNLNAAQATAWKKATRELLQGKRIPAGDFAANPKQRVLDACILEALGIDSSRLDELYEDTGRMRRVRKLLAAGRGAMQRERFDTDVAQVAKDIAQQVAPLVQRRRFPEDYLPSGASTRPVQLGNTAIRVEANGMLGHHHVVVSTIDGTIIFNDQMSDPIGEVMIRAAELGRRDFEIPTDEHDADAALRVFDKLIADVDRKLNELAAGVSDTAQSTLRELAEQELNVPVNRLREPVNGAYYAEL